MSKGISGLFKGTYGQEYSLRENYNNSKIQKRDFSEAITTLPGNAGVQIKKRLSDDQMIGLTKIFGVEFAQIYKLGAGKNGRGGKYYLYSGNENSVIVPIAKDIILINHTHPGGTCSPSRKDMILLSLLSQCGSPQKVSSIIPAEKNTFKFTSKGKRGK